MRVNLRLPFARTPAAVALLGAAIVASSPVSAQQQLATASSLEVCRKAVNVLGASMGHTEVTDAAGRPAYRFILRTAGMDYEAVCDATTGVVGDVSPRRPGAADPS